MNYDDGFRADYSYWLKVLIWDSKEASALLAGYDPDALYNPRIPHPDEITYGQYDEEIDVIRNSIRRSVEREHRILERARLAGELGKTRLKEDGTVICPPVSALDWVAWASRNDFACDGELVNAIAAFDNQESDDREVIHPRRETTLLRVIGALLHELRESTSQSQAQIVKQIIDMHGHKPGIAKSTLENVFSGANRRLADW